MKIKTRYQRAGGFTLVEIMIVIAIIGLITSIALPNFIKVRTQATTNACVANLHKVDAIVSQWALDEGQKTGDAVDEVAISSYLRGNAIPVCPADGSAMTVTTVGTFPTCGSGLPGHEIGAAP